MRKKNIFFLGLMVMLFTSSVLYAQKKTLTWTSPSEAAVKLCSEGVGLFKNIEFAQAYEKFNEALALDPDFTIALVFATNLSRGEAKKALAARAVKSAANKTEGEKLFASTVAEGSDQESTKTTFEKLYTMFPDGTMLGAMYVFSKNDPEEQFKACQEYQKRFPDEAWINNIMGYYYMQVKKDFDSAKKCFDKYMEMYPEGCNAYDSMGEYYFNKGDMENSEKYYNLSLDKYPFNNSSINKLREIKELKTAKDKKSES